MKALIDKTASGVYGGADDGVPGHDGEQGGPSVGARLSEWFAEAWV